MGTYWHILGEFFFHSLSFDYNDVSDSIQSIVCQDLTLVLRGGLYIVWECSIVFGQ